MDPEIQEVKKELYEINVNLIHGGKYRGIAKHIQVANGLLICNGEDDSVAVFPLSNIQFYNFRLISK
jgi:hypothetical protein